MANLFDPFPAASAAETFTALLTRGGTRIERIVSTGQSTPEDAPYDQDHDEWVLLLKGGAGLWMDGQGDCTLRPGDHLLIPAHCRHRVARSNDPWSALTARIKRRTDTVGVFPNEAAAVRPGGALSLDQHDEWAGHDQRSLSRCFWPSRS